MGVVPPGRGFLRGLRELCDAHGTLLIFDEVITGFRVAPGGAQALFGVRPDLTCLGKIIGGGLPVGAYGGRADLMELVSPAGPGLSGGHAVGQSARDDRRALVPRTARRRRSIVSSARARGSASPPASPTPRATPACRCRSTRSARCSRRSSPTARVRDFQSATSADTDRVRRVLPRRCWRAGIYPPPSQFEAWFLSAAHTASDVDQTIAAARAAMKA